MEEEGVPLPLPISPNVVKRTNVGPSHHEAPIKKPRVELVSVVAPYLIESHLGFLSVKDGVNSL